MAVDLPSINASDIDEWIDLSTEGLTFDDEAEIQPSAKRAKTDSGNSAVRKQQNREAARRSRMRKKQQESELQDKLANYTKSNEALKKHNQELQDMLDLARYQLANLSNGGSIQPIEIPNVVDPLAVPSHIEISVPEVSLHDSPCGLAMPTKRSSEVSTDISEFIDVFFEKDDWAVNKESAANEVSDDGSDHLDFILENDFWLDEENTEAIVSAQPTLAPQPRVQVVSPVLSLNLKSSNEQVPPNLSRKEKNRIHARNRRMKLKMEHAKLKQSVDAFTQSNALLKKKNKELELMLLKAHSYVAGATKGYQHYSTVFADGAACIHSARCGKEKYSDAAPAFDDVAHRSSVLGELDDDDDNHSLSFLWN